MISSRFFLGISLYSCMISTRGSNYIHERKRLKENRYKFLTNLIRRCAEASSQPHELSATERRRCVHPQRALRTCSGECSTVPQSKMAAEAVPVDGDLHAPANNAGSHNLLTSKEQPELDTPSTEQNHGHAEQHHVEQLVTGKVFQRETVPVGPSVLRSAQQALAASKQALSDRKAQVRVATRAEETGAKSERQGMAELSRLTTVTGLQGAKKQVLQATELLQHGASSWLHPDELRQQIQVAIAVGVEAEVIQAAEATLFARRERLRASGPSGDTGPSISAGRAAWAAVLSEDLAAELEVNLVHGDDNAEHLPYVRSLILQRMVAEAELVGVDAQLLDRCSDATRHLAQEALHETLGAKPSLSNLAKLSVLCGCCSAIGLADQPAGETLLIEARASLREREESRMEFVITALTQLKHASSCIPAHHEVALLEEAIEAADEVLEHSALEEGMPLGNDEKTTVTKLAGLKVEAKARLEDCRCALALTRKAKQRAADEQCKERQREREALLAASTMAVEACEERLRVAIELQRLQQELERTERSQRESTTRANASQEHGRELSDEQLRQEQQRTALAQEEARRLKQMIKVMTENAQVERRKVQEEFEAIRQKAKDEVRKAYAETKQKRADYDKALSRLQAAMERQGAKFQEGEDRRDRHVHEMEQELKTAKLRTREAQEEASQVRAEQANLLTSIQQAEREARDLAKQNADVAKQALDAQREAEVGARQAQAEYRQLQHELSRMQGEHRKSTLNKEEEMTRALDTIKHQEEDMERLKARLNELIEEVRQERDLTGQAHKDLEATREELQAAKGSLRDKVAESELAQHEHEAALKVQVQKLEDEKVMVAQLSDEKAKALQAKKKLAAEVRELKAERDELQVKTDDAVTQAHECKAQADQAIEDLRATTEAANAVKTTLTKQVEKATREAESERSDLESKYGEKLAQKERQLQYAEGLLTRTEEAAAALKSRFAGETKRVDDDVRYAYGKVKVAKDETEALRKELGAAKASLKAAAARLQQQQKASKEKLEQQEKTSNERLEQQDRQLQKQESEAQTRQLEGDQIKKNLADAKKARDTAEAALKEASVEMARAQQMCSTLRDQLEATKTQLAIAGALAVGQSETVPVDAAERELVAATDTSVALNEGANYIHRLANAIAVARHVGVDDHLIASAEAKLAKQEEQELIQTEIVSLVGKLEEAEKALQGARGVLRAGTASPLPGTLQTRPPGAPKMSLPTTVKGTQAAGVAKPQQRDPVKLQSQDVSKQSLLAETVSSQPLTTFESPPLQGSKACAHAGGGLGTRTAPRSKAEPDKPTLKTKAITTATVSGGGQSYRASYRATSSPPVRTSGSLPTPPERAKRKVSRMRVPGASLQLPGVVKGEPAALLVDAAAPSSRRAPGGRQAQHNGSATDRAAATSTRRERGGAGGGSIVNTVPQQQHPPPSQRAGALASIVEDSSASMCGSTAGIARKSNGAGSLQRSPEGDETTDLVHDPPQGSWLTWWFK